MARKRWKLSRGDIVTGSCYKELGRKGTVAADINGDGLEWEVTGNEGGWPRITARSGDGRQSVTLDPEKTGLILYVIRAGKEAA